LYDAAGRCFDSLHSSNHDSEAIQRYHGQTSGGPALKTAFQWLLDLHAPTGRWAPFAASGLFAAGSLTDHASLRVLLDCAAAALALLIAADLARALMERQPAVSVGGRAVSLRRVPVTPFQFVLTGALAAIYTWLIFVGMGPFMPIVVLPIVFLVACFAAWRNVRLWYLQGSEYEDELNAYANERAAAERLKQMRIPRSQWDRRPPFP
jgi:hypothetical protein